MSPDDRNPWDYWALSVSPWGDWDAISGRMATTMATKSPKPRPLVSRHRATIMVMDGHPDYIHADGELWHVADVHQRLDHVQRILDGEYRTIDSNAHRAGMLTEENRHISDEKAVEVLALAMAGLLSISDRPPVEQPELEEVEPEPPPKLRVTTLTAAAAAPPR